jgi:galactoside O-acetyltransferase
LKRLTLKYFQKLRITLFRHLADISTSVSGKPTIVQPVQYAGKGHIYFGENVIMGVKCSPYFYDGSIYMEVRGENAKIRIGNNVFINNNLKIICDKSTIEVGDNTLIGYNVNIIDSDFHHLHPQKRTSTDYAFAPVKIGNNVFIGANVTILKGVSIGENTVVASGAIVTKSFDKNLIIGGNPAKIIGKTPQTA